MRWIFRNLKIQSKIVAFYLPLVLIPLMLIGWMVNYLYSERVLQQTIRSISDNSELIIGQIERTIGNGSSCANMLTIQLSKTIIERQNEPYGYLNLLNAINGEISRASVVFPEVESIAFISKSQAIYSPNVWIESSKKTLKYEELMKQINATNGVNIWLPMEPRSLMVADPGAIYLTLGKKIIDIQTGDTLGSLVLSIKETSFSQIFKGLLEKEQRTYFIVDRWNRIISSSDDSDRMKRLNKDEIGIWLSKAKQFNQILDYKGESMLITCRPFDTMDWRLITATPISQIYADVWRTGRWIITVLIVVAIVAIWVSQLLSRHLARPIKALKNAMLDVESGQWDTEIDTASQDEIGSLSRSFKRMRERIQELIFQVNVEEGQKRAYELALISAQIKPHFLYNTLDAIYVLAQMNRMEQVSQTTKALADFYRVALSGGAEIITLKEEIKNVIDYLTIQKIRYADVFDYEIDLPYALENERIVKMTIQPLVENAIYHGLKEQREFGHLKIAAFKTAEGYSVLVNDNGLGIAKERIQKILSVPLSDNSRHFGLFSVNRRIELYYGKPYGIEINSELGEGTSILVSLPLKND